MKDDEKVKKCLVVLSGIIVRFLERCKKTSIVFIDGIDNADAYTKQLNQSLFESSCKLIFIGSMERSESTIQEIYGGADHSPFQTIFGCSDCSRCKEIHLHYLNKWSVMDVFKSSLKDISEEDQELLDSPLIVDKVHQLCKGIPRFAVELAQAVNLKWMSSLGSLSPVKGDRRDYFETLLQDIPSSKIEELICYRFDHLTYEGQMLLKIASVAGFDNYSFSQNLIETLILSFSRSLPIGGGSEEINVPTSVGNIQDINKMFQGEVFEQILETLIEDNYLEEVSAEMGDVSSLDTELYRFVNRDEQMIINGLMLEDQKMRTHHEVAQYYETRLGGDVTTDEEWSNSAFSSDFSMLPSLNWQMLHITALHYDMAEAPIKAMVHYFDSGSELARLGVRDRAHGSLLSSYLMLEKRMHQVSELDIPQINEGDQKRWRLSKLMVEKIGSKELPLSMQKLTPKHLEIMFASDIDSFVKCITMLTKFGQSVGTIEKEGYKFGSDIYLQAIFLLLLALKDAAFERTKSRMGQLLGLLENSTDVDETQVDNEDGFFIEDLAVSFPAFSGLLTFYRDSPIEVNKEQETTLANLFVAVTKEASEDVHMLRTKCILSHLYLKHGDVTRALEESEDIKRVYEHEQHSLELAKLYGMDWCLICIGTMTSIYIFRGEITAAFDNIRFLEQQLLIIDEFASSTKAMMCQFVSSLYLILLQYRNAKEAANGISQTQYPYFYKPSGILQEGLSTKLWSLYDTNGAISGDECTESAERNDFGVCSILDAEDLYAVNHNRSMLFASIETLSDRGIEAIKAALCVAEIEILEREKESGEILQKQIKYCISGLAYLHQSLQQKDANSEEKRINYMSCLYQKAELLAWHKYLRQKLCAYNLSLPEVLSYGNDESEIHEISSALRECENLSDAHDYPFMLMLVGWRYVEFNVDSSMGERILQKSLQRIKDISIKDYTEAKKCLGFLKDGVDRRNWNGKLEG